ncbi:hypothetical protein AB1Y20_001383 [Prymnesium parvum]|uniref:TLC domain-containing protein n=1 Tax=Prymnesium parvum TaxID=97485 RepID=A0AB34K855_PRYPA
MAWVGNAFCAERYDRVLATVAPLMIVSQYVLYAACRRFIGQPKVNADALKHHVKDGKMTEAAWAQFWKDLSGQVWCCCFHIAFSCLALYGAANYVVLDDVSPERRLGDYEGLIIAGDAASLQLQEASGLLGSVFAALMVSFLFYWFLGWDNDRTQLFHHIAFMGVSFVLARRCSLPFVGATAMAMEGSSPALALMQIFRQLEGDFNSRLTTIFTLCFVASFFFLRVCLFGYGLLSTLHLRLSTPQLFPKNVPAWEIDIVLLLLLSGWMLQLFWASQICKKLARMMKRKSQGKSA